MSTTFLEFIMLTNEMRIAQKQSLKFPEDQNLTTRRLQLEMDVDASLHAMANELQPKKKEVQS
nr:hypothetical protein [uncultured Pedobacter sp.]